jgi:hypothetical protein
MKISFAPTGMTGPKDGHDYAEPAKTQEAKPAAAKRTLVCDMPFSSA